MCCRIRGSAKEDHPEISCWNLCFSIAAATLVCSWAQSKEGETELGAARGGDRKSRRPCRDGFYRIFSIWGRENGVA